MDPNDGHSSSQALASAIDRALLDAAKTAMSEAVEALQERLAQIEEHLTQEISSHSGVQRETGERALQRVTEITSDSNHALVSLSQALSATNQRLNQVAIAIGERIGAVQDRIVEGDKQIDQRVDRATQQLLDATAKLGTVRQTVEQQHAQLETRLVQKIEGRLEGRLEGIATAVSVMAERVEGLEEVARTLASIEPRMSQLIPKFDATPGVLRALDERFGIVEKSQRFAASEIQSLRRQNRILVILAAMVLLAGVAAGAAAFLHR